MYSNNKIQFNYTYIQSNIKYICNDVNKKIHLETDNILKANMSNKYQYEFESDGMGVSLLMDDPIATRILLNFHNLSDIFYNMNKYYIDMKHYITYR